MPKTLDIGFSMDDVAKQLGGLVLKVWQMEKQIRVLEVRVDELEMKYEPEIPPPPGGAPHA